MISRKADMFEHTIIVIASSVTDSLKVTQSNANKVSNINLQYDKIILSRQQRSRVITNYWYQVHIKTCKISHIIN